MGDHASSDQGDWQLDRLSRRRDGGKSNRFGQQSESDGAATVYNSQHSVASCDELMDLAVGLEKLVDRFEPAGRVQAGASAGLVA